MVQPGRYSRVNDPTNYTAVRRHATAAAAVRRHRVRQLIIAPAMLGDAAAAAHRPGVQPSGRDSLRLTACTWSAVRRIALVGLPGVGKSTVGRQLARRLRLPFVDSDHVIEQRIGCTIREFFEREGEAAFRDIEQEVHRRPGAGARTACWPPAAARCCARPTGERCARAAR